MCLCLVGWIRWSESEEEEEEEEEEVGLPAGCQVWSIDSKLDDLANPSKLSVSVSYFEERPGMLVAGEATSVYQRPFIGWLPLLTMAGDSRTQMKLPSNNTMKYEWSSMYWTFLALHLSSLSLISKPFYR